jgi:hypothetical protein
LFCLDYGRGTDCDEKLATAVTSGFLLLVLEEREIYVECREGLRHIDFQDPQATSVITLNDCLGITNETLFLFEMYKFAFFVSRSRRIKYAFKEFVQRMWTIYRFVEFALKKLYNTRKTRVKI